MHIDLSKEQYKMHLGDRHVDNMLLLKLGHVERCRGDPGCSCTTCHTVSPEVPSRDGYDFVIALPFTYCNKAKLTGNDRMDAKCQNTAFAKTENIRSRMPARRCNKLHRLHTILLLVCMRKMSHSSCHGFAMPPIRCNHQCCKDHESAVNSCLRMNTYTYRAFLNPTSSYSG